ncbi:MAG: hypothetical protein EAX81_06095 [Candidatus Thorarchaeota archaeon]|nr:hypothetical protein [Candidatus Thorarchaeota archaeon]
MTKVVEMSNGLGKTPCGRCSCIIVYTGDYCLFCDAAKEMLGEAIAHYGVSDAAICQVDVDSEDGCGCNDGITRLPTIRICNVKLEGLPDEKEITDAVLRALMMDCFCEDPRY